MNRWFKLGVCTLACLPLLCAGALAAEVEQIQAVVPDIQVYLQDPEGELAGLTAADVTAALDGEAITVKDLAPARQQGINYFFLLDVSGSIPAGQFDAAKQAVLDVQNTLTEEDTLSVITFGSTVNLLLDGSQTPADAEAALSALSAQDANTRFYDAMAMLVQTVLDSGGERNIAVVVSDGVDAADDDTGMTRADLEALLRRSGVALYALAVDTGQDMTEFSDFIALTGGELYPFAADTMAQALNGLRGRVGDAWVLDLNAPNARADGEAHELSLTFGDGETLTVPLELTRWTPDTTAPTLTGLQADAAGAVTLRFSEAMSDPARSELYELLDADGKARAITDITVSEDGCTVVLHFDAADSLGGWTLSLHGMTDASMEQNALPDATLTLGAGGSGAAAQQDALPAEVVAALALLGVVVLAAVALVAGLSAYTRRKARKAPQTVPADPNAPAKPTPPKAPKQKVTFFFDQ